MCDHYKNCNRRVKNNPIMQKSKENTHTGKKSIFKSRYHTTRTPQAMLFKRKEQTCR